MTRWAYELKPRISLITAKVISYTETVIVTDVQITAADLTALTANFVVVSETQIG